MAGDVVSIDPLTIVILLIILAVVAYICWYVWRKINKSSPLDEKRGMLLKMFAFSRNPTVPTIRIAMRGDMPIIEIGKRATLRENSLCDRMDTKGWDITSSPILIKQGDDIQAGYLTHPAGCTLPLKINLKVIKADEYGKPIYEEVASVNENGAAIIKDGIPVTTKKPAYVEANFEGVIGTLSDLDDFNESSPREVSRNWIMPFIVGCIAGVIFLAPLFAWGMSLASHAGS